MGTFQVTLKNVIYRKKNSPVIYLSISLYEEIPSMYNESMAGPTNLSNILGRTKLNRAALCSVQIFFLAIWIDQLKYDIKSRVILYY